jgi:hypothetical protein
MTMSAWFRLLRENRFAVTPTRIPLALSVTVASAANSLLAGTQSLFFKRRISATQIPENPIFVIGHWRSGTTLLHQLLTLDSRHTYPDTYACLAPSHFLISRYLVPWWLGLLMPKRRPMDNVPVGWKEPQEDEWAFCLQGLPSVYRTIAFPRRLPQCPESLTLDDLPTGVAQQWEQTLTTFLNSVMIGQESSRLVLKSPTHTARIGHLYRMFPHARFIHVVRDPLSVFPSTMKLWTSLATDHGLQLPDEDELRTYVIDTFTQMYDAFESQRTEIPEKQICDVRYEHLVADPVGQLARIYQDLDLGQFEQVRPHIEQRTKVMRGYQTNQYQVSDQERQLVSERWSDFCDRYSYDVTPQRRLAG